MIGSIFIAVGTRKMHATGHGIPTGLSALFPPSISIKVRQFPSQNPVKVFSEKEYFKLIESLPLSKVDIFFLRPSNTL